MQWLIFDAVGTLIRPRTPVALTYHSYGATHGSRLSIEDVRDRFSVAFTHSEQLSFVEPGEPVPGLTTSEPAERCRWRWVVRRVFDDVPAERTGPLFDALWQHYAQPAAWSLVDDADETLCALHRDGWRQGVASNFDSRLDGILRGLGLAPPIESIVVSSRIGWRKPAVEFYRHLIEACGVSADEICVIGDNYEHDVAGPRWEGMRAVLLNHHAECDGPECVRSLAALCAVLR